MKEEFVVGDYIKIIYMDGEPEYNDKEGKVLYIDDMGQLHGTWGGIAVNLNFDKIIIKKRELK